MSKDIRSYFSVKSSKKVENVNQKAKEPEASKKKKRAIFDSDSDEEIVPRNNKTIVESPVGPKRTKVEKSKGKEPEKDVKLVNASEVFGNAPIQRTARKTTPKGTDLTDDPDTFKALQEMANSEWDSVSVTQENGGTSSVKETPIDLIKIQKEKSGKQSCNAINNKISVSVEEHQSDVISSSPGTSSAKYASPVKSCPSPKKQKMSCETSERTSLQSSSQAIRSQPQISKKELQESEQSGHRVSPPHDRAAMKRTEVEKGKQHESFPSFTRESAPVSHLWVDKYKPTSLKQIIGQQGENSNVKKLLRWLSSWHTNHAPGANKKKRPNPWEKDSSGSYFKAALLSGPPGVGKTTTAHLVCKELGMDVVEFNASDTRSKKLMNQEVTELLSSKTLLPFFQSGEGAKTSEKHVLVMDEVDGMAGNEDRGGVQELISLIKNSKCPVICMCNDRNHPKIRSLANYCFDLRFYKPRLEQIKGAMMSVCFKEKVQIPPDALSEVIAATNCDIRQVLHNLSMWSAADKKMSAEQTKVDAHNARKHIKLGPWDTVKSIFSAEDHSKMSLNEKSDLFFNDYNIMALFVQENYLIVSPKASKKPSQTLRKIAQAATSISYGDLVEKTIRSRNDAWSLLPVQAIYSCVVPGDLMEGHLTRQIQFPSWLGKNSTYGKMNRLLQELQLHMRLSISGGKQAVNLDYISSLQSAIVKPLEQNGSEGVPETLQLIQDYHLTLADLESLFELSQWSGQPHPMSKVESKVKAALTRTYNKSGIMTPYSIEARVSKRRGTSTELDEEDEGRMNTEDKDSDSDSDDAVDGMIKVKKQDTGSKAAASSSRGSCSGRGSRGGSQGRGKGRGRGKK